MANFIILLIMSVAIIGPYIVITTIGFVSIRAMGLRPSAASQILPKMILKLVLAETAALVALMGLLLVLGH